MTKAYEDVRNTLCHAVAEGANLESLPCAGDDLPFEDDSHYSHCVDCEYFELLEDEKVHVNIALPEVMLQEIRMLRSWWVDLIGIEEEDLAAPLPDDQLLLVALDEWTTFKWEELSLQDEIKRAHENGGRTEYLYTENGEEYYTTTDGIRHYTRVEG